MKMPYGKFKGRHVHDTPRHYLRWALATLDLSGDLKKAMLMGSEKEEWNPPDYRDLDEQLDEICCDWGD